MKNILTLFTVILFLSSCNFSGNGLLGKSDGTAPDGYQTENSPSGCYTREVKISRTQAADNCSTSEIPSGDLSQVIASFESSRFRQLIVLLKRKSDQSSYVLSELKYQRVQSPHLTISLTCTPSNTTEFSADYTKYECRTTAGGLGSSSSKYVFSSMVVRSEKCDASSTYDVTATANCGHSEEVYLNKQRLPVLNDFGWTE